MDGNLLTAVQLQGVNDGCDEIEHQNSAFDDIGTTDDALELESTILTFNAQNER
jgi:hypothetical protein